MVRNHQPTHLQDASRQQQNMGLDLHVALRKLEQASGSYFRVRLNELIFPEKIWLICETNLLSRYMTWADEEGCIMINLNEFEKLLHHKNTSTVFKTRKLVSFIRQFNLYDFKKKADVFVDLSDQDKLIKFGLYFHNFLRPRVCHMLQHCCRKVVRRKNAVGNITHDGAKKKRRMTVAGSRITVKSEMEVKLEETLGILKMHQCTAPPLAVTSRTGTATRTRGPVITEESEQQRKEDVTMQRASMIQSWLATSAEWNQLPEIKDKPTTRSLLDQYNWGLDPMAVGELASLANYIMPDEIGLDTPIYEMEISGLLIGGYEEVPPPLHIPDVPFVKRENH